MRIDGWRRQLRWHRSDRHDRGLCALHAINGLSGRDLIVGLKLMGDGNIRKTECRQERPANRGRSAQKNRDHSAWNESIHIDALRALVGGLNDGTRELRFSVGTGNRPFVVDNDLSILRECAGGEGESERNYTYTASHICLRKTVIPSRYERLVTRMQRSLQTQPATASNSDQDSDAEPLPRDALHSS